MAKILARFFLAVVFGVVLLRLGAAQPIRDTSYEDTKGEGKALVAELLSRYPEENREILGLLKIRAPDQPLYEIPVKMTIRVGENGWQDIYESQPVLNHPAEILIVQHQKDAPNRYFHGRKMGVETAPQKVEDEKIWAPFAGSDFFLGDLGLEFLHWPSQKIVKKEMRKGRSCRVVESINPNPESGGYSRVLSWIDLETGGLVRAEGYDPKNKLLKEFSVRSVDRKERTVKEIEMRNERTDARTRLEFNVEIEE